MGEDFFFFILLLSLRGAMATAAGAAANSTLCEVHNKPLKFFCQNELALICPQCAKSKKHHTHTVLPMEEAAQKKKVSERLAFLDNLGISLASHPRYVHNRGEILQGFQAWNSCWEA